MLTLSQYFQYCECCALIKPQFQLNVDHAATYSIATLIVFELVRNDSADNVFIQRF